MAETRTKRLPDTRIYERKAHQKGFIRIAGIDEVGRGPLAGPVVAAAVILPRRFKNPGILDSKQLTPDRRLDLYTRIYRLAVSVGVGIVDAAEIDRINILQASLLAMSMATRNLQPAPDYALVDGKFPMPLGLPQRLIPHGDALSISISAASIVAKVTRDRLMERYNDDYPQYGFASHKGYATRVHRQAILQHGCCPIHRRSFHGVREVICRVERTAAIRTKG